MVNYSLSTRISKIHIVHIFLYDIQLGQKPTHICTRISVLTVRNGKDKAGVRDRHTHGICEWHYRSYFMME